MTDGSSDLSLAEKKDTVVTSWVNSQNGQSCHFVSCSSCKGQIISEQFFFSTKKLTNFCSSTLRVVKLKKIKALYFVT